MKKNGIMSMVLAALVLGGGVFFYFFQQKSAKESVPTLSTEKMSVIASFYPLAFLAEEIGGEKAVVMNLTPAGAEPHEYEPTPQDMMRVEKSRLIVLNGGGLETWGDSVQQNTDPMRTVVVIASEGLATQQGEEEGRIITDPHIWLSPPLVEKMIEKIETGFVTADAANAEYYRANAEKLQARLRDLDVAFMRGLADCERRDIVTSHAAFGYLATAYGLKQVAITGISPDAEPSAKEVADIASFARENGVKYIFFESLVSPKIAKTVAEEIGAETLVLNPIEGLTDEELAEGKSYFTEMMMNLANLETALQCNT